MQQYNMTSLLEAKALVNEFRALDLQQSTIEDLFIRFKELTRYIPFLTTIVPKGATLHRFRVNTDGQTFSSLREIWYPPVEYIQKPGRLNDEGEQLLYLANHFKVALAEAKLPEGTFVTHLEVLVTESIRVTEIGMDEIFKADPSTWQAITESIKTYRKHLYHNSAELLKLDQEIRDFWVEEFTKTVPVGEEHLYKRTIAIAKQFMGPDEVGGIMYPSIAFKGTGINIALKPIYADKYLRPVRLNFLEVKGEFFRCHATCTSLSFHKPIIYGDVIDDFDKYDCI